MDDTLDIFDPGLNSTSSNPTAPGNVSGSDDSTNNPDSGSTSLTTGSLLNFISTAGGLAAGVLNGGNAAKAAAANQKAASANLAAANANMSTQKKWLIFGGVGLAVVVVLFLVLRRK
jgi:hypothetical protein